MAVVNSGSFSVLIPVTNNSLVSSDTTVTVNWSQVSQSESTNSTTISWTVTCVSSKTSSYVRGVTGKLTIDGVEVLSDAVGGISTSTRTIGSGTTTIYHNADGAKSFNMTLWGGVGILRSSDYWNTAETTKTYELLPILQTATLLDAPNFIDTDNPTIYYSNPSGNNVIALDACISFTGQKDDVPYRAVSKTGTEYTFNLTTAERTTLRAGIKTGDTTTVRFYLRTTKHNGEQYYSIITKTFSLVDQYPTLNPTVKDTYAPTIELTGDNKKLVRYFSNAEIDLNAQAKKEATLVTRFVVNGTQTLAFEDTGTEVGTINGVESNTFYFTIIDSRDNVTKDFIALSVGEDFIPYVRLTGVLTMETLSLTGNLRFNISGNYYNGSFGAQDNTLQFEYGIRENDGDITWVILDPTTQGTLTYTDNGYSYNYTITGLNPDSKYTITGNVIDALMSVQTTTTSITSTPVYDWGEDDFNHNTRVYIKKNQGLRTIDNDGNDISVLNPCNPQGSLILGWGQYANANGDTSIYGDTINLVSNNGVNINGSHFGHQQVLWQSTGWYMNASQTISLSEPISQQSNGIVLVFSLYRDGVAEDASIQSFFVSKKEVELLPGAPHTFFLMINSGFSVIGAKYLYIDDQTITGHATNSTSGSNNNMTYNNDNFVLRYVIGV